MRQILSPDIINRYEGLRHDFLQGESSQARQWRGMAQQGLLAWAQVEPPHRSQVLPPCPLDGEGIKLTRAGYGSDSIIYHKDMVCPFSGMVFILKNRFKIS